jgi:tRNA threonylcarbamoyl adenosine modification protein YeaZ
MLVLALESSTDITTVALGGDGIVLAEKEVHSKRYSETIMLLIDELLRGEGLDISKIDGFAVGTGPGSFTGVRAGIVTIKTLSQALRKPAAGISSSEIVASAVINGKGLKKDFGKTVVLMDAKRNEYYSAEYQVGGESLTETKTGLVPNEKIDDFINSFGKDVVFSGTAMPILTDKLLEGGLNIADKESWSPRASQLIGLSSDQLAKVSWDNLFTIAPIYWRPSDALTLKERMAK